MLYHEHLKIKCYQVGCCKTYYFIYTFKKKSFFTVFIESKFNPPDMKVEAPNYSSKKTVYMRST